MINSIQTAARNDQVLSDADLDRVSGGLILTTLFVAGMIVNAIKPGAIPFLPSARKE